jgi:glycosyltransferase involved in cell wall biosynthesis
VTKVLVVSSDHFGSEMAGPAIRYWEMCKVLAAGGHQVRLGANSLSERDPEGFSVHLNSTAAIPEQAAWAEVVVVHGLVLQHFPALRTAARRLVVDLYDPFNLEILEHFKDSPWADRIVNHSGHLAGLTEQLQVGDFFICASEKQRDYWLGALTTAGRINPYTHGQDPLLRQLIDVVPFGITSKPAHHSGTPAAKGVLPGIGPESRLVIWGGGIYNWFDPLSLLRAWPRVLEATPSARLLFLGIKNPNPEVPAMHMATRAVALSEELGLRGRSVHFNLDWVPYDRRQDFLLEAEIGVSMHFDHLETAFSFRTRILDYIWAGLPIVATEGDEFASWIETKGTGRVVRYGDPDSIAAALSELLTNPAAHEACAKAIGEARPEFTWERALAPLARYCTEPWLAPDLLGNRRFRYKQGIPLGWINSAKAPRAMVPRMLFFIRHEGLGSLIGRLYRALVRRLNRPSYPEDPR